MAAPNEVRFGTPHSGVVVRFVRRRRSVEVSGWYDSMVGIEGGAMPLGDFLQALGLTPADCAVALGRQEVKRGRR